MKPAPPVTTASTRRIVRPAVFISFEGLDGSGKTTQAELLAESLRGEGRDVLTTREPGGTPLGEEVRRLLLEGVEMSAWAEAALFAAARAELADTVISPALAAGRDVVCDRYLDSSLAYQGIARGLGVERVLQLNLNATEGLLPDRTFLVLVDPEIAAERKRWQRPDRARGPRAPAEGRPRLPRAREYVPEPDHDGRRQPPTRRDRRGDPWTSSRAFLNRPRPSGSCAARSPTRGPRTRTSSTGHPASASAPRRSPLPAS